MDNLIIPPAPPVVEPVEPIDPGPWYYAQLNGDGRCVCVSQASAALPEADHLVRLESYDETVLGQTWVDGEWVSPPPAVDPTEWLIDVGPFMDRFGVAKMPLLISSNTTVKALIADIQVRKWIDLKRPDVAAALDALIALGISGMTPALKASILDAPVTAEENLALRKVYFS